MNGLRPHSILLAGAVLLITMLACTIPVPTAEPLQRIDPVTETLGAGLDGASRAVVKLRMVAGDLEVRSFDGEELLRGQARYNVKAWKPKVAQETEGAQTTVTISQGIGSQIPLTLSDEDLNAWLIELRRGVPLDLNVDVGTGTARFDLSALQLTGFTLTSGGAETYLTFSQPNPTPLGTLRLTAGASTFTAVGLGNANLDRLTVIGATGTLDLDFSGAFSRSAIADIKAGAGKITIRVPQTLGVRVVFSGIPVSSVDLSDFVEQSDDVYVNEAYGIAPLTLTVNLTAGVGTVHLISQ